LSVGLTGNPVWIPAFAGMTGEVILLLSSVIPDLIGNPVESDKLVLDCDRGSWIPAFAGMTINSIS